MTVSKQIIEVLDALCQKFGIVIDWTSANVLPYLETLCGKLIKWEIANSIFYMVFWTVIAGILWLISKPFIKKAKEDEWDFCYCGSSYIAVLMIAIACIFTLIAVSNIGIQSYDIIEAVNFPEKTIYDFIKYHINLPN